MLVLTRKLNEQISIGQDITITVLRLKGNTVRIGIEAPDEVRVVRGELPRFDAGNPKMSETRTERRRVAAGSSTAPSSRTTTAGPRTSSAGLKPLVDRLQRRESAPAEALVSGATAATVATILAD